MEKVIFVVFTVEIFTLFQSAFAKVGLEFVREDQGAFDLLTGVNNVW